MSRAVYIKVIRRNSVVRHVFACEAHKLELGECRPLRENERNDARCTICRNAVRLLVDVMTTKGETR